MKMDWVVIFNNEYYRLVYGRIRLEFSIFCEI